VVALSEEENLKVMVFMETGQPQGIAPTMNIYTDQKNNKFDSLPAT